MSAAKTLKESRQEEPKEIEVKEKETKEIEAKAKEAKEMEVKEETSSMEGEEEVKLLVPATPPKARSALSSCRYHALSSCSQRRA